MIITRRFLLRGLCAASAAVIPGFPALAGGRASAHPEPQLGDDGLYKQPWLLQSFLDLKDDLAEAAAQGKHFCVLWEQRGCPYCLEVHRVNFAHAETRDFITANFHMLQFDLWGPRKVTDFDGKEMAESELARRWRVTGTPAIIFFPNDPAAVQGKAGGQAEIWRMVGYWKPFHFLTNFEYVRGGHYKTGDFQRFLQAKAEKLKVEGKDVKLW